MEDRDYQATQDAAHGRLATSMLRYLTRWQAGRATRTQRDVERLNWLKTLLIESLGGARRLSPQSLAPEIEATHGPPREEIASYHRLRAYSGASTPEEHSAWVEGMVALIERLATNGGWESLSDDDKQRVDSLKPLLRWLTGASDRSSRESPGRRSLIGV